MVPPSNQSRIVGRISGQATGGEDDILIDDRGRHWKRITHDDASATAPLPGPRGRLTNDGRIIW